MVKKELILLIMLAKSAPRGGRIVSNINFRVLFRPWFAVHDAVAER